MTQNKCIPVSEKANENIQQKNNKMQKNILCDKILAHNAHLNNYFLGHGILKEKAYFIVTNVVS